MSCLKRLVDRCSCWNSGTRFQFYNMSGKTSLWKRGTQHPSFCSQRKGELRKGACAWKSGLRLADLVFPSLPFFNTTWTTQSLQICGRTCFQRSLKFHKGKLQARVSDSGRQISPPPPAGTLAPGRGPRAAHPSSRWRAPHTYQAPAALPAGPPRCTARLALPLWRPGSPPRQERRFNICETEPRHAHIP